MILGIDTSIGTAVAIVDPAGRVRAEAVSPDPRGHAEVIGDLLVRVFGDAGVGPAEITAVAAGMGPGPFTGLRVGIAAARAFALGRGIPLIPVASHDAAARAHVDPEFASPGAAPVEGEPIAIVTDARRRELAVSVYRVENGMPVRIVDPHLVPRAATEPLDLFGAPAAELAETTSISAAALARVAAERLASGAIDIAIGDAAEPLYLRAPDVTVPAGPKKVGT
ncbi:MULTISPECIES: tRNA (adenosine(37)-N6)-threonylcarbamoyltransferase complex dimerization subunit type 1 TsaB [Microbacterium]|uniref:tRNA (adenosine(37)-N6)-threonylcarbamoyltransferase complex dimerization subunit type 1 TsaB n=1 Tax=Microbacterium TaxID=33882 RepID=UPI000E7559B7|nr:MULTISPECIES: tRNA (adenosine(37)-N6)-threonylcarbamoyltransferase complex dimerization subunit type 1 TsaB [Microbacterium]MDF2580389.1 tRNA ((37)-N6)-threonylcarbamoyltransferase complex dimerization subunit type 1 TsaB [Microbacterium sp.]RKE59423.1 tRNA threonylcarbamoyl adenosine modification protein YeaZ [Microbacterium sp. AG238]WJM15218.1 tRNA (adenosine(37)-N6)-threonylcarbamoyltransferase complex dimerization subunit type 1 TsaB [Microbacterium arborescens]